MMFRAILLSLAVSLNVGGPFGSPSLAHAKGDHGALSTSPYQSRAPAPTTKTPPARIVQNNQLWRQQQILRQQQDMRRRQMQRQQQQERARLETLRRQEAQRRLLQKRQHDQTRRTRAAQRKQGPVDLMRFRMIQRSLTKPQTVTISPSKAASFQRRMDQLRGKLKVPSSSNGTANASIPRNINPELGRRLDNIRTKLSQRSVWKADPIKKDDKLRRQMLKRGWTDDQIDDAIRNGQHFPAKNEKTGGSATRYVHPETGRSVIIDNTTKGVIHVGGDGFRYDEN